MAGVVVVGRERVDEEGDVRGIFGFLVLMFCGSLTYGGISLSWCGQMKGVDENGSPTDVLVNSETGAIVTTDADDHFVHTGETYSFYAYDVDLDSGATVQFLLSVPAGCEPHVNGVIVGALTTLVEFFEDATHSTSTVQTSYNMDRNSVNTSCMTIHLSNEDGADGTRIDGASFGISTGLGTAVRFGGGESGPSGEGWILDPGSYYLLRVTSGADNNNVMAKLNWHD